MKRRFVGVSAAIALALIGTLIIVAYVGAAEDRALAGEKTVDVYVAAKTIEEGTPADEIEGSVDQERVPAKVRAQDAVTDLGDLGERVASSTISPGEQITNARFIERSDLGQLGQVTVPDGLLQVTVALAPERAVGGQIQPGATVGVLASFDPFQTTDESGDSAPEAPNSTAFIKHKALVTAVQQSDQAASNEDDANQAPTGNLLVTMALTAPEVERVVFTAEHGFLWLAFEPQDAPTDGTQVTTRAEIYP